ncbi:MAG: hypothetical protein Tsb0015_01620 [Simkaniaceae bacterium]
MSLQAASKNLIDRTCVEGLKHNQSLGFDPVSGSFYSSDFYLTPLAKSTAAILQEYLKEINCRKNNILEGDELLLEAAEIFLDRHIFWYQKDLDAGLAACKSDPFLMNLVRIDRYLAAIRFRNADISEDRAEECFKTKGAKEELKKWINEPTRRGIKRQTEEKVVDSTHAGSAFVKNPLQVDFIKEHHIEKYAGTRNDHIKIDACTKEILVKYEGEYRPVSWIMENHDSQRQRLYKDGVRIFYKDKLGLAPCVKGDPYREDPEHFDVLPIYKCKETRKHADFRLEIRCAVSDKWTEGNHGWLVLKNPSGEVRSFGYFWREGDEPPHLKMLHPEIGEFHADGDRYDYMRVEDRVSKTCISIDENTHNAIIKSVEEFQNDRKNRIFNPVNHNCVWFIHHIVKKHLDIDLPIRGTLLDSFVGFNLRKNFFIKYIPPIRVFAFFLYYLTSVARNFTYLLLGARFWGPTEKRMFHSVFDLFNPKMGMPYHPSILKKWQQSVEKVRQKKIEMLRNEYERNLREAAPEHRRELEEELNQKIYDISYSLPKEALPPKPTWKEYVLDIFFPILGENEYFCG